MSGSSGCILTARSHGLFRRHAAFLARVSSFAANPLVAAAAVKASITSFRASESTARDLISTIHSITERNIEATGSLIVALVDLLDNEEKRTDLLQSWNGFKIEVSCVLDVYLVTV